ncbi:MAG: DUF1638 domain-containing protein [Spirochaetota bacterium]
MKLRFIGCGVFRPEVQALIDESEHEIDARFLPQGLHAKPGTLREELQAAIDETSPADGYHAIIVGYGLCSRGTAGILARNLPVIIPRIHDCIAAFLGSHKRYAHEFRRHPGTYWFTRGFIATGGQPGVTGKYRGILSKYEDTYEEYVERYGEETARYLVEEWAQGWIDNYTRAAFVPWDYPQVDEDREFTKRCAANLGWEYEEIPADLTMMRDLLAGRWHPETFLEVLPGRRVVAVHDARIIDALAPEEEALLAAAGTREETRLLVGDASGVSEALADDEGTGAHGNDAGATRAGAPRDDAAGEVGGAALLSGLGIGIDAGGTYTDAALYDFTASTVLASAKAPTTPADPSVGAGEALAKLPSDRFGEVKLVSLATTFATNAIVEGRGGTVGLLLLGYDEWSFARVEHRPVRRAAGSHTIDGTLNEPLDESAVREAVRAFTEADSVEAIAIVEWTGCRNPEFETRAKEIALELFDGPVQCAHELTSELDCIRRATTVAVNCRIAPVIVDLVRDVEAVMEAQGIAAPLSVVRADGSVISGEEACRRPVEMVLSGPAASICGAHALTGTADAIVVDMGGTTSDVARLSGGRPMHNGSGADVGGHRTTVRAPALHTTGLGGDSRIGVDRRGRITVGPRRVLPLCRLVENEASLPDLLRELHETDLAELSLLPAAEIYVLQREPAPGLRLTDRERAIVEILRNGPASILGLSRGLDYAYLTCIDTSRLEEFGIVIRAGFTPTDLVHVEGRWERWSADVSRLALGHLAARAGVREDEFVSRVRNEIKRLLARVITAAGMGLDDPCELEADPLSARLFASALSGDADGVMHSAFSLAVPVIGIGAPAHLFVPEAAEALGTRSTIPERAGVAGAVGAITGTVMESVSVLIRPGPEGFTVHAPDGARSFALMEAARAFASDRAVDLVRTKALGAGADRFFIRLHVEDRKAPSADGGVIYIDTRIRAEAAGAPRVR